MPLPTPRANSLNGRWPMPRSAPPPFISPLPRCWSFSASNARTSFGALLLIAGMGVAASLNRGAMLVIIFMLTCGSILGGRLREFAVVAVRSRLLGLAYAADLDIPTARETRNISAEQLVENVASIFGARDNQDLSGTKEWRLHWWDTIIDYTINGAHFWTGKGFGVDLGADDNVIHISPNNPVYPTRSPHSAHLTMLARAGVPGLALWLLTLACWGTVVLTNMVRARLRGDHAWASFFLLTFCYACGFLIDASVDVTLEGPMAGIWFWCVFGVGSGASTDLPLRAGQERSA